MMPSSKKWLFPLFHLLFVSFLSYGQEGKTYEGPLQIGPYHGKAKYQYSIIDLDTVFDGDFLLQKSNLETLVEDEDLTFRFAGYFDKGVANGPWEFQFGEFQTNSQTQIVDNEYRVLVSGVQEIGKGELAEGQPNGNWTYTINKIKDSKIEKILFKSDFTLENGVPQQNFQIENDSTVLVGRFLRNGLAHDEWSFYGTEDVEDIEDWFFEDGLLQKIHLKSDGIIKELSIFSTQANYRTIALDERYLALLDAVLDQDTTVSHISKILGQNLEYYEKINEVLQHLGSDGFKMDSKVRVPYYPLDSLQNNTLEQIVADYKSAAALSRAILENSHLNIVKRNDPEAFFYYNVTQKINDDFLTPLARLVGYKESHIIEFQEISNTIERLWPSGKPEKNIVVAMNEDGQKRTFNLPSSNEFAYEGNDLLSVAALSTYAKMSLEFIKGSLASRLTNEEQLQMLNGLEEELLELDKALEEQIESAKPASLQYEQALEKIRKVAESSLTLYADIKNPKDKLAYGEKVKSCLVQLRTLAQTLISLPDKQVKIKEIYTNAVWNPFMANVMEEEVKKRIVDAYQNVLVPFFITTVTNELDCDNAASLHEQIELTHKKILDLRDKDTKKLERKLRKEKRPLEVLKLLNVQSNAKTK